jgi:hypothetical protein
MEAVQCQHARGLEDEHGVINPPVLTQPYAVDQATE